MKQKRSVWPGKYLDDRLDLREQIFRQFVLIGMFLGVVIAASSLLTGAGAASVVANLLTSAAALAMLEYGSRRGSGRRFHLLAVIFVFLVAFPALFFTSGGPHGGTPSFFVFAVAFTVFVLRGRSMYLVAAAELAVYGGICLLAYRYPATVTWFSTEGETVADIVIGFTVASVALGVTVRRYARIYDTKQEQLAEANAALDRQSRMKTEFLGNISHELKTPLTVISGYAQESERALAALPAMAETAELARAMKLIASEADRLALMVSQVLDVTRIEEGRMSFELGPAPLSEILQSTLATYYPAFAKNNNTLEIERGGGSPVVLCDRERISQVLVNLIANAARHTHNGAITIGVKEIGGFAEVSVKDNGEGIPPELLGEVFERFKTAAKDKSARPGRETGTGLGLYISKHIVEEHGGRIAVESGAGGGTTVRFTLPLQS